MTDKRKANDDKLDAQLNEWKAEFALLIKDIDEAKADGDNAWEDFKAGVENVWADVKAAFS